MAYIDDEDDRFLIDLTIDGTEFENVCVEVTDPNKPIREQIERIVSVFELPTTDKCGNPMHYILGQIMEEGDELTILELDDEEGREMALVDYNIQPGDSLYLISIPLAGYACPIPEEMQLEWANYLKSLR